MVRPSKRRHPEHIEGIHRDVVAAQSARLAAPVQITSLIVDAINPLKIVAAPCKLQVLIHVVVCAPAAVFEVAYQNAIEVIDVFVREGIDDDGVDDAVHRGRGTNSQRERTSRDDGEAWLIAQVSYSESKVLKDIGTKTQAATSRPEL